MRLRKNRLKSNRCPLMESMSEQEVCERFIGKDEMRRWSFEEKPI
jgi:hypothetical protein